MAAKSALDSQKHEPSLREPCGLPGTHPQPGTGDEALQTAALRDRGFNEELVSGAAAKAICSAVRRPRDAQKRKADCLRAGVAKKTDRNLLRVSAQTPPQANDLTLRAAISRILFSNERKVVLTHEE